MLPKPRPHFISRPKPARLPWRNAVTIGIGVLCSSNPRPHLIRPDGIILMADTMGSTDTDSTSELHKLYVDDGVYAVCAGKVEFASEVISILQQELKELPSRRHGLIYEALNKAVHEHRMSHFRWDVMAARYSFMPGAILESQQQAVVDEWQRYNSGLQMLVSIFHHSGLALLFYVGQFEGVSGWVQPVSIRDISRLGVAVTMPCRGCIFVVSNLD